MSDCPYATEDWYCSKPAGHDGPHESVQIGTIPPDAEVTDQTAWDDKMKELGA